jgi:hypothetical protein
MSAVVKQKGPAEGATSLPSHVQPNPTKDQEMNSAEATIPPAVRTIAVSELIDHRDELYRICRLCDALDAAFDGAQIMREGIRELLTSIESALDAEAEKIHGLTFAAVKVAA